MIRLYSIAISVLIISVCSCSPDDDSGPDLRDRGEVESENRITIQNFLETHSYEVIPDPRDPSSQTIRFNAINSGSGETPIIESDQLKEKEYTQDGITYQLYYLQVRKGDPESYQPTVADRVILSYETLSMDLELADAVSQPTPADLPGAQNTSPFIRGATEGLIEFKGASSVMENEDGTLEYSNDYGIGAIFIPSGLAYFATPPGTAGTSVIGEYEPIIFSFKLYRGLQTDHDGDGIPSIMEDLNGDGFVLTDNTDNDNNANYLDPDDDNDGVPTSAEIIVDDANGDGIITEDEITFIDRNGNGEPDYLEEDIN